MMASTSENRKGVSKDKSNKEFFSKCRSQRRRGKNFFLSVGARRRKEVKKIISTLPLFLTKHFAQVGVKKLAHANFNMELAMRKKFKVSNCYEPNT